MTPGASGAPPTFTCNSTGNTATATRRAQLVALVRCLRCRLCGRARALSGRAVRTMLAGARRWWPRDRPACVLLEPSPRNPVLATDENRRDAICAGAPHETTDELVRRRPPDLQDVGRLVDRQEVWGLPTAVGWESGFIRHRTSSKECGNSRSPDPNGRNDVIDTKSTSRRCSHLPPSRVTISRQSRREAAQLHTCAARQGPTSHPS